MTNRQNSEMTASAAGVDALVGRQLFEVKHGVSALRTIRESLMHLADVVARHPGYEALLVLPATRVTRKRLEAEWVLAATVLRPELTGRILLCVRDEHGWSGIPRNPDPQTQHVLAGVVDRGQATESTTKTRGDATFVVLKVLMHHWLRDGAPVTTEWLARTAGYSYPTIAGVLNSLGSLLERMPDRRVRLRWFAPDLFDRLCSLSDRARATARFADRSGQARSPEAHVRRLERLAVPDLAIGGVLGALHHLPSLDLTGAPRLDLSQHCAKRQLDLRFVTELDPALRRIEDPLEPASLVVHAVRHAESLFSPRDGGLCWADPLECLLDLAEARLNVQGSQFQEALLRGREKLK